VFVKEPPPQDSDLPNGEPKRFSPPASSPIHGSRDAVLTDPGLTTDRPQTHGDRVASEGRNTYTITPQPDGTTVVDVVKVHEGKKPRVPRGGRSRSPSIPVLHPYAATPFDHLITVADSADAVAATIMSARDRRTAADR
jgi:hypothetical protein